MRKNKTFESCFFYKLLAKKKGIKFFIFASLVLAIPYLIISVSYLLLRADKLMNIPIDFWFDITSGSVWFVVGPVLVYRFINEFIALPHRRGFTSALKKWFSDNAQNHYNIYSLCMKIVTPIFILIAIPMLLCKPEIITQVAGISYGYMDPYFWIIIVFLIWFLIYCTNAISIIILMIIVTHLIKKHDVLRYSPIKEIDHKCIQCFFSFCNNVVFYMCSGLLFMPIAILFLRKQVYVEWVSALLLFYSVFLFAAITYPKITMRAYANERSMDFLLKEKIRYFNTIRSDKSKSEESLSSLITQIKWYNSYFYIQELKTVCCFKVEIDTNTIAIYISALVSAVPGIIAFVYRM